ncbi:unnamed protein product, partial [Mycena citricolor]
PLPKDFACIHGCSAAEFLNIAQGVQQIKVWAALGLRRVSRIPDYFARHHFDHPTCLTLTSRPRFPVATKQHRPSPRVRTARLRYITLNTCSAILVLLRKYIHVTEEEPQRGHSQPTAPLVSLQILALFSGMHDPSIDNPSPHLTTSDPPTA